MKPPVNVRLRNSECKDPLSGTMDVRLILLTIFHVIPGPQSTKRSQLRSLRLSSNLNTLDQLRNPVHPLPYPQYDHTRSPTPYTGRTRHLPFHRSLTPRNQGLEETGCRNQTLYAHCRHNLLPILSTNSSCRKHTLHLWCRPCTTNLRCLHPHDRTTPSLLRDTRFLDTRCVKLWITAIARTEVVLGGHPMAARMA